MPRAKHDLIKMTLLKMESVYRVSSSGIFCTGMLLSISSIFGLRGRRVYCSFEWQLDMASWRSSVNLWNPNIHYRQSKGPDTILADSVWHCSYCFRTIPEFIDKMKGFLHSDRIGGNMQLLDPRRIQEIVCKGKDIFGTLPEAYSVSIVLKFF